MPTRGVLITSLLVMPPVSPSAQKCEHLYEITGSSLWHNFDLLNDARLTIEKHRKLLEAYQFDRKPLEPFRGDKRNAGRPCNTELQQDIALFLRGELNKTQVIDREMKRDAESIGKPLTEQEENTVRARVQRAINRASTKKPGL